MTAWHDQPPLSRRQARQNQRGEADSNVAQLSGEVPTFPAFPRAGWEQDARAAQPASPVPVQENRPQPGGRRAQREYPQAAPPIAEPLDYQTQARPQVPSYDGPAFRSRSTPAAPQPTEVPAQNYRVRDFSPEGRRSAFSSTTPETPGSAPLEYHTQGAPIPPPSSYPAPPAPTFPVEPPREQTLSRRELRALQQASAAPTAFVAPVAPPANPDQRFAAAMAEFDALAGQRAAQQSVETQGLREPAPFPPAPQFAAAPPVAEAPAGPAPYTPPVGHWSTQAEIDDGEQFQENTLSRNIGATSGAITTSALVIPSIPSVDALRPFGTTGEILITGTIDLPRSIGSIGTQPGRYDHSDVDALIEAGDREDSAPDSAPVRAIRAVSTHSSTRGVIQTKKPKGNSRLPIVLAVAAAAMAVGVIVLFVAGMIFKIF